MKIKSNFILRRVADTNVVLPLGASVAGFKGMLTLNDSGVMLWELLMQGSTKEELALALENEYEVGHETALSDVDEFIEKLKAINCIDM